MRRQKGIVLIFVLLMVLAIMAAVVGYSSQISQYVGRADRNATMAERVAQTGLDHFRTEIFQDARRVVKDAAAGTDADKLLKPGPGGEAACNLLGQIDDRELIEPILLDRQKGGGYGRFEAALTVPTTNWRAQGWLTSKGQVLTGLNVEDPNDPLKNYRDDELYPEAILRQTLYAHNASLMSHALITNELLSPDKGLAVAGPIFIAEEQELEVGSMGNSGIDAVSGDIVPYDYWPCLDNDNDGKIECGEKGATDETVAPARPWDGNAPRSGALDLKDMLAEGGATGPGSLCTRIRMPQGQLTGSNQDNDPYSIGQLYNITGVHVGIRPDSGGVPVNAGTASWFRPTSRDDLAILAGFKNRPSLTTPYDLDPIPNPAGADTETYTGELEVRTGLADYYSSAGITGEQEQRVVTNLNGGETGLEVAASSPGDGIIISYEWLRVDQNGKKYEYYIQHQGIRDVDACTGGNKVIHPKYDTSADTNASFVVPPVCSCPTCAAMLAPLFPTTVGDFDSPVISDPGDIVWPTYDRRKPKSKLVSGTGNINDSSAKRIPMFNMDEEFECVGRGGSMTWDPGSKTLEVTGAVTIEGIELPLEKAGERINVKGDGVLTLREREIRLIADHKSYKVVHSVCRDPGPIDCTCAYDVIVADKDFSLPTKWGANTGNLGNFIQRQSPIDPPESIYYHRFATFVHGGKAGYSGSSDNGFTQALPSWTLEEGGDGWGDFPKKPDASIPMIVSDPNFPSELADQHIYAGIWYHDEEIKFKGNAAAVGRVMAPKVTVEDKGAQIFGVSGYEYHLNTDFEDWLRDGAGLSPEVIKNLPVFNVASETLANEP